jgi:hypothetical protein
VAACFIPDDGDIVIRDGSRSDERIYILYTQSGPEQYVLRSRDEAISQATRFATSLGVRVWIADEDDYTLVVDCADRQRC